MNITTNAQGKERKNLVKAIAEITGQAAKYNGAPAITYMVGNFTVERDGSITTEDEVGMKNLATELQSRGFEFEMPKTADQEEQDGDFWTLTMPREDFTEQQIENLEKLLVSKANLIKKALESDGPT